MKPQVANWRLDIRDIAEEGDWPVDLSCWRGAITHESGISKIDYWTERGAQFWKSVARDDVET